jgi:5-methylcytosine-specific restriction enzyme A
MALKESLQRILTDYPASKEKPLENDPLAQYIRKEAATAVSAALGGDSAGLVMQGSPGQGNWAAVPWIGIFDPAITTSATEGYYVVYLFHAQQPIVHLLTKGRLPFARSLELKRVRCFLIGLCSCVSG